MKARALHDAYARRCCGAYCRDVCDCTRDDAPATPEQAHWFRELYDNPAAVTDCTAHPVRRSCKLPGVGKVYYTGRMSGAPGAEYVAESEDGRRFAVQPAYWRGHG